MTLIHMRVAISHSIWGSAGLCVCVCVFIGRIPSINYLGFVFIYNIYRFNVFNHFCTQITVLHSHNIVKVCVEVVSKHCVI